MELIGHRSALSRPILCRSFRLLALRLVGLRLLAFRWFRLWLGFLGAAFAFRGLHRLIDRSHHIERLLRQVVMLAVENLAEAANRFLEGNVLARTVGEDLGDEERLREEPLDLPGARDQQLVVLRELI